VPVFLPLAEEGPAAFALDANFVEEDALARNKDAILYNAAGVRVEPARVMSFDAGDELYRRGDRVMCEGATGTQLLTVAIATRRVLSETKLPRILRRVNDDDTVNEAKLRGREQIIFRQAKEAANRLRLPIKVVRAQAVRGGESYIVYFASEQKITYRELLRTLSQSTRERIELRQIGMRDAAKLVGGVGPCGLQLCCNTFLSDFAPVSIKMAKDQGLALNPQKVSGVCGRLLCCLVYEEAYYRAARKLVPRFGEKVWTSRGLGHVKDVDVLQMQVRVILEKGEIFTCPASEIDHARKQRSKASDEEDDR
jgi:cell fate regulator YaaT (PSP1 superfamily)